MRVFRVILVLGAILHLTGGHWGILQGIAWAKMLVEYSQADGLLEGARKTFDGQHPCCMCKSIATAKERESGKDRPALPGIEKFSLKELRLPELISLRKPRCAAFAPAGFMPPAPAGVILGESPPLPPPRGV